MRDEVRQRVSGRTGHRLQHHPGDKMRAGNGDTSVYWILKCRFLPAFPGVSLLSAYTPRGTALDREGKHKLTIR